METKTTRKGGGILWILLLRLFLCFFVACIISAFLAIGYITNVGFLFLSLIAGPLVGLILAFSFAYNLYILEIVMHRLSQNLPVSPLSLKWRGSLKRFFVLVNELAQPIDKQTKLRQQTVEYRDQLLQQVGKNAAQEERNRLARDLHDSIKQQIFSITVSAAAVKARWEHNISSTRKIIDDIERTALEAQVEMQALLQQLRPVALENVGLLESLRVQCQALGYRTGVEVIYEFDKLPDEERLPIGSQEMMFRIVQEGFANIARHARAAKVWLALYQQGNMFVLEIGDDGQGFDIEQKPQCKFGGMGLLNVRERVLELGGQVSIWSQPEQGTTLHIAVPLVKPMGTYEQQFEDNESDLALALRGTGSILSWASGSAWLAGALVLISIPNGLTPFVVFLCIVVSLSLCLAAYFDRMQIILNGGRLLSDYLLLKAKGLSILKVLCVVGTLYLSYFTPPIVPLVLGSLPIVYFGTMQYYQSNQYYQTLPSNKLQSTLEKKMQQVIIDFVFWALINIILLVFWLNIYYPQSFTYWTIDRRGLLASAIVSLYWFIDILVKCVQTFRWQRSLSRMEASYE